MIPSSNNSSTRHMGDKRQSEQIGINRRHMHNLQLVDQNEASDDNFLNSDSERPKKRRITSGHPKVKQFRSHYLEHPDDKMLIEKHPFTVNSINTSSANNFSYRSNSKVSTTHTPEDQKYRYRQTNHSRLPPQIETTLNENVMVSIKQHIE